MANKDCTFVSRWGDAQEDSHYSKMPGWVLQNMHRFVNVGVEVDRDSGGRIQEITTTPDTWGEPSGLRANEQMFVTHVMAFKFDTRNGEAKPSLGRIAEYMGLTTQAVRNIKNKLVQRGALRIEQPKRRGTTPDTYNFSELARQCLIWEKFTDYVEENNTPQENLGGLERLLIEGIMFTAQENLRGTPQENLGYKIRIVNKKFSFLPNLAKSELLSCFNSKDMLRILQAIGEAPSTERELVEVLNKETTSPKKPSIPKSKPEEEKVLTPKQEAWQNFVTACLTTQGADKLFDGSNFNNPAIARHVKGASELRKAFEMAESSYAHAGYKLELSHEHVIKLHEYLTVKREFPAISVGKMAGYVGEYIESCLLEELKREQKQNNRQEEFMRRKYGENWRELVAQRNAL